MARENEILERLRDAIVELDICGTQRACEEAITAWVPAYCAVIEGMAKGMKIVGEKYEAGENYLAELIMAWETMREGMVVFEPHLAAGEVSRAGKALIGTVKGDLHDIGKNVFLTLLSAANYDVIDLGVDVSPEGFLEAVKEHTPDILAMSALLTTTMVEMESVVAKLERARLGTPRAIRELVSSTTRRSAETTALPLSIRGTPSNSRNRDG